MWRSLASNMISFLIVGLFLLAGTIIWGQRQYVAEGPLNQAICFRVPSGASFSSVSERLAEQGAISSGSLFRVGADYQGKSDDLKAGSYLVEPGTSMAALVDQITRGGANTCGTEIVYRIGVVRTTVLVRELDPQTQRYIERTVFEPGAEDVPAAYTQVRNASDTRFRVAVAEGVTSWQVVEGLKAVDALTGEIAERPAEGLLAPDSYEFTPGTERSVMIEAMESLQAERITEAWLSRNPNIPLQNPEELLILASIVEKETGVPEERGQVASVFENRLNRGMRLQTDPTVIYGVTEGVGVLGRGLRQSELARPTPWNTYVIEGLPITPICNPGLDSLLAAAQPAETEYVFFVADGSGGHAFAETLEDHNRNVARWREIERQQQNSNN
ncbi:endolytic transglycosylase MltG [Chachezhania sediminis]|uniref:endolytic transglycosylase MltG n=1 Tax=Chachezhania sediminis TaxID=2599291 RepID=UPI00131A80DA|nr:endolytic transglycosylase MltG [Chachezhania sediminis]